MAMSDQARRLRGEALQLSLDVEEAWAAEIERRAERVIAGESVGIAGGNLDPGLRSLPPPPGVLAKTHDTPLTRRSSQERPWSAMGFPLALRFLPSESHCDRAERHGFGAERQPDRCDAPRSCAKRCRISFGARYARSESHRDRG